mgnify:FL=1
MPIQKKKELLELVSRGLPAIKAAKIVGISGTTAYKILARKGCDVASEIMKLRSG